jgi:hypothetical protein
MGKGLRAGIAIAALLYLGSAAGQTKASPSRIWTVGPLTKGQSVMGISFGPGGPAITPPHIDTQTRSIFSATRSIAFAADRIVVSVQKGMRRTDGNQVPVSVFELLSIDAKTGEIVDRHEFEAYASLPVFATNDEHIIVCGRKVFRLTPDLKDAESFEYEGRGHKLGQVENISSDGSTLGNATSPGFELVDSRTLFPKELTKAPSVDTSVNVSGFITDNIHWVRDFPKDSSFVTYIDFSGEHLLYHGTCGGRPQFITNELILEPGRQRPLILDMQGRIVKTLPVKEPFSYAGVSQNGARFALQIAKINGSHDLKHERFIIFSVQNGDEVAEIEPDEQAEGQSWTAFSPDGSLFVVGSPFKLTLWRLP